MRQDSRTTITLNDLHFVDTLTGWAVGGWAMDPSGILIRTTDGGITWTPQPYRSSAHFLQCVFFIDRSEGWIGGEQFILHTTNGGDSWQEQTTAPGYSVMDIQFVNKLNGWAVGADGTGFRTSDGGTNWVAEPLGISTNANRLSFVGLHDGWAVGDNGVVLHWCSPSVTAVQSQGTVQQTMPGSCDLSQNYPNPFNPTTTIRYSIPHRSQVAITVFNTLGQRVATLVNESQEAGPHDVRFDASGLASGVYFYRLQVGSFVQAKKLLILR